eukprot:11300726-Alexandrium_andersonii.AAC.1
MADGLGPRCPNCRRHFAPPAAPVGPPRDRGPWVPVRRGQRPHSRRSRRQQSGRHSGQGPCRVDDAVSYTHLTLPTICSV